MSWFFVYLFLLIAGMKTNSNLDIKTSAWFLIDYGGDFWYQLNVKTVFPGVVL